MHEKISVSHENQKQYEFSEKTGTQIMDDIENLFSMGNKPKKITPNGTALDVSHDKPPDDANKVIKSLYKHADHNLDKEIKEK